MLDSDTCKYLVNEFTQRIYAWDSANELVSNLAKIGISIPDGMVEIENQPLLMPQGKIAIFGQSELKQDKIIAALSERLGVDKRILNTRFYFNLEYEVFHKISITDFTVPKWAAIIVGPNDHKNKNTGDYSSVVDRLRANKYGDFPYTEVLNLDKSMSKTMIVESVMKLVNEGVIEF